MVGIFGEKNEVAITFLQSQCVRMIRHWARVHHVVTIPVLEGGGNSDGRREMVDLAMNGVIFLPL